MISLLIGAIPGLVGALAIWLAAQGVRHWRYDPVEDLDAEALVEGSLLRAESKPPGNAFERLGGRFVPLIRSALPIALIRRLQRRIDLAGRPQGTTVDTVLAQAAGLGILLIPAAAFLAMTEQWVIAVLAIVAVGFLPLVRLVTLARQRRERIDRDLPDFLDVLAVTVSAGVGFRSALATVARRFGGPVAEEITTALQQIANGASVRSAFRKMRDRTDSNAVEEFVTAYLQAEELGAPLVDALNQIAEDMRHSAAQASLQKASKVSPQITLVTTLAMVPGTLILILVGLFLGMNVDFGGLLGG